MNPRSLSPADAESILFFAAPRSYPISMSLYLSPVLYSFKPFPCLIMGIQGETLKNLDEFLCAYMRFIAVSSHWGCDQIGLLTFSRNKNRKSNFMRAAFSFSFLNFPFSWNGISLQVLYWTTCFNLCIDFIYLNLLAHVDMLCSKSARNQVSGVYSGSQRLTDK